MRAFLLALIAFKTACSGEALAVYPSVTDTFQPWSEQILAYNRSSLGDVLRNSHAKTAATAQGSALTLVFLDRYAEAMAGWRHVSQAEVESTARDALNASSVDPMISYCLGREAQIHDRYDESLPLLRKSWMFLENSPYPAHRKMACTKRLTVCYRLQEGPEWSFQSEALCAKAIHYAIAMLRDKDFTNRAKKNLFADWLSGSLYENQGNVQQRIRDSLIEDLNKGGVDPWLEHAIRGIIEINKAWEARGGGYANTVTKDGWKGFADHLAVAEQELTKAWEIDPSMVMAPACMITVCMGTSQPIEQHLLWFNRALAAQMDCEIPYQRIFEAFKPRWGGDYRLILAVGSDALATGAFKTEVPMFFIRALEAVLSDITSLQGDTAPILTDASLWKKVSAVYEGYLAEPADVRVNVWLRTCYAGMAWRFNRHDTVQKQFNLLGDSVDPVVFQNMAQAPLEEVRRQLRPQLVP